MKYRLYIDEVGNADLRASDDPSHRYLSLTGVMLNLDYVMAIANPRLETLKRDLFASHPDDPLVFHRRELIRGEPPFEALHNPQVRATFDVQPLALIRELDYQVITVAIDKLEHKRRYTTWRFDPYHYCLAVLLERYVQWLGRQSSQGDVMAESRGSREDKRLKQSFSRLYETGTDYVAPDAFHQQLTSKELKIRQKQMNITGLQLADLVAYPSFQSMKAEREPAVKVGAFSRHIIEILKQTKYLRSPSGRTEGWGEKWLP